MRTISLRSAHRPLHYAAYNNHIQTVEMLLEDNSVDVNSRTGTGCTALFLAAQQGHEELVRLLLRGGADPSLWEEECFFTPVDVSRLYKKGVWKVFGVDEEYAYEPWRAKPGKLEKVQIVNCRHDSFEIVLPSVSGARAEGGLEIREFKVKVVDFDSGGIVDLIIVPRLCWGQGGGEREGEEEGEENIKVRGLGRQKNAVYGVMVSGISGMGYGEYSDEVRVELKMKVDKVEKENQENLNLKEKVKTEIVIEKEKGVINPTRPPGKGREKKDKKMKTKKEPTQNKTLPNPIRERTESMNEAAGIGALAHRSRTHTVGAGLTIPAEIASAINPRNNLPEDLDFSGGLPNCGQ